MSNIQNPSNPPVNAPTTPTSPEAPAQASMTSLPHTNLDSNAVSKQVNSIFEQAGLVRGADGGLQVKDTASLGKTNEVKGLQNFEQVYGSSETTLKPPGPPRVEMTDSTRVGAEAFAANMDKVIDDILVRPKTQQAFHTDARTDQQTTTAKADQAPPGGTKTAPGTDTAATPTGVTRTDTQSHGQMADSKSKQQSSTLPTTTTTTSTATKAKTTTATRSTTPSTTAADVTPATRTTQTSGTTKSIWKMAVDINQSPEAEQYRTNMTANTSPTGTNDFARMTELTADMLLAAFLKLNIMDPNNSVETHQKMHNVMTKLRQRAIADAKQKMKVAAELREEAEKEADSAGYVSSIMSTIRIIACVVAMIAAFTGVGLIVSVICAVIVCACTIVEAKANQDAAQASCDAAQADVMGKRAQLMAERAQEQIEEEAEIIKMIIESKNKMVDSVIRMMNAMFGASQKLMSAGMAKG